MAPAAREQKPKQVRLAQTVQFRFAMLVSIAVAAFNGLVFAIGIAVRSLAREFDCGPELRHFLSVVAGTAGATFVASLLALGGWVVAVRPDLVVGTILLAWTADLGALLWLARRRSRQRTAVEAPPAKWAPAVAAGQATPVHSPS